MGYIRCNFGNLIHPAGEIEGRIGCQGRAAFSDADINKCCCPAITVNRSLDFIKGGAVGIRCDGDGVTADRDAGNAAAGIGTDRDNDLNSVTRNTRRLGRESNAAGINGVGNAGLTSATGSTASTAATSSAPVISPPV